MVKLNARCSAILQNELPLKEKDPGSFILPCTIGTTTVRNALADLGASISIMPFTLFKRMALGNPKPVNMVIEIADRSMQSPKGIVENVLIKIKKFIFPIDFIILGIIEDDKVPIILRRPMLAIAHARIDVFGSFPNDNDLLPNLESQDTMFLSPLGSVRFNNSSSGMFYNTNSNSSISLDDFVKMDDVWDNLDLDDLTNEVTHSPFKPEFLSTGNRTHLHSPYNLQVTCKIGFVNFAPYIEPQYPFNIMSRKAYNSIMKHELVYTGNNTVGFFRNLHVFVGGYQFLTNFIILESINEFVEKGLTEVLFGQPFKEHVRIVEDWVKGVLWFKIKDDKTIFNMPRAEERFGRLTVRQHNTMGPLLKISDEDKSRGILILPKDKSDSTRVALS
ncbi:homeodomain-like protein [Tanacetum coccineum]